MKIYGGFFVDLVFFHIFARIKGLIIVYDGREDSEE